MICEHCQKEIELRGLGLAAKVSRLVCWQFGMKLEEIGPGIRTKEAVAARRMIWWELVIVNRWSLPRAGAHTGGHDHTTVLYGIWKEGHDRYGLPMKTPLDEIRSAWVLDPDSQPLVETGNERETEKAA